MPPAAGRHIPYPSWLLREGSVPVPAVIKGSLSSSSYSKLKYHIVFMGKMDYRLRKKNAYSSEFLTAKLLVPSLKVSATRQEPGGCPECHGHWTEGLISLGSPLLHAEQPTVTPELLLTGSLTRCVKLSLSPCTCKVAFRGYGDFHRHPVPGSGPILPIPSHRALLVSSPLQTGVS